MNRASIISQGTLATDATAMGGEIDLAKLFGILWRGKLWIVLCGALALCAGIYYAVGLATPIYTTHATVALESRQNQVVDIESVVSGISGDQVAINTEVEVLRSRRLIGKVVADLNLTQDPEFNHTLRTPSWVSLDGITGAVKEDILGQTVIPRTYSDQTITDSVINNLLDQISVSNVRQSYVFHISAFSESPEKSAQIANRLAELYVEDQIALKFEKTAEATEWLTDRVAELQISLETSESELKEFSNNTNLISPEGLVALNRQLKDMRERLTDLTGTFARLDARVSRLKTAQETGDLARMAEAADTPEFALLLANANTVATQDLFRSQYAALVSDAELERSRAQTQRAAVNLSVVELERSIDIQSDELVALQQLQREAEASRLIYEFFLNRLKETSVQQGLQQAESRILSSAIVPVGPSSPRMSLIFILSLLLGLFGGSVMVLLREFSQNTFRLAEDLEAKTGYDVIGQVPKIPARKRKNVVQYLHDKPNSAAAEAIRNLRTSLLLANLDRSPKVIMSTSSVPGEGKTTQSIALALNLAGLGKKVLLVEGDIRRRVMTEYFDIPKKYGFLSVILDEISLAEAVTTVPDMKFDVLVGETSQTNAADIFSSERFGTFLDTLRAEYDFVIIDTPPVLAVTDARIIGRWVDTTIYTVRWDQTSHRQVVSGLKALEQVNVKVAGLVLGQISAQGMKRYGYDNSYGGYQSYYRN
ncbi:GumC family protein [Loktanella agnita]|uniref:GumC family protein n=1 Tax=Loktanella agnita TaxID=287097 RepID=UPI003989A1DC